MKENFQACLAQILKFEGGKSDNPADPGGRTNQGITQATYSAHLGHRAQDVYAMPASVRDEIYKIDFWDKIGGDGLSDGVDLALFDFAVNSGPERALRMWMATDPMRPGAMPGPLITKLCNSRLAFMQGLRTWHDFGPGWKKRVAQVEKLALSMAAGEPLPIPKRLPPGSTAAGAAIGAGAGTVIAASRFGMEIAWIIGIGILTAAAAISILAAAWQMRPAGAAKASLPELPKTIVPKSLTPELDIALANLAIKKAAFDEAVADVAMEREHLKARIAALIEAATAGDSKLGVIATDEPPKPPTAPALASVQDVNVSDLPAVSAAQKGFLHPPQVIIP